MKNARIIREIAAGGGITSAGAESESDFKLSSTYHRKPKDEAMSGNFVDFEIFVLMQFLPC